MKRIEAYLENVKKVAITGHVSPDGDCVGSCLGLLNYLRDTMPQITAHVYLQEPKGRLDFLPLYEEIRHEDSGEEYDLLILLDISSKTRIGFCESILERTAVTLCLDHHLTNPGGFTWMDNDPAASSASEMVYRYLDPEKISLNCATCLYTGIVFDTGVFQYSCTSPETMRIAAELMEKGVPFTRIIDENFFQKTFLQNKALGTVLASSELYLDGLLVVGIMTKEKRWEMGVRASDLDSVVAELRNTAEADTALFLYELDDGIFKASLRSRSRIDVSVIAAHFGGGGHVRAAGCRMDCGPGESVQAVIHLIEEQIGNSR